MSLGRHSKPVQSSLSLKPWRPSTHDMSSTFRYFLLKGSLATLVLDVPAKLLISDFALLTNLALTNPLIVRHVKKTWTYEQLSRDSSSRFKKLCDRF